MLLSRVDISNYRSIKHVSIDMNSITAIVGKNNYGKSALLDAIQCFYGEKTINDEDFHMGTSDPIEIKLIFNAIKEEDINRFFSYNVMLSKVELKIKSYLEKGNYETVKENELSKLEDKRVQKRDETIEKFKLSQLNEFEYSPLSITLKKQKSGRASYYLTEDISISKGDWEKLAPPIKVISAIRTPDKEVTAGTKTNLKELISMLEDRDDESSFINIPDLPNSKINYKDLKTLISEQEEVHCDDLSNNLTQHFQESINNDSLSVKVKIDKAFKFDFKYKTVLIDKDIPDKNIDILSCGTGLQSMLILSILQTYLDMKIDNHFLLLIEEPEVYLHPSLQRKMINTLINISNQNQVILTTHSPIVINKIDQPNILCVRKTKGITSFEKPSAQTIIEELGIQASDVLNKEAVIFVEGKDDLTLISELIDKIVPSLGLEPNFREKYIELIQTEGFEKMYFYANARILQKSIVKTPYWVLVDSDGEEIEERKNELIEKGKNNSVNTLDSQIKVLKDYAIESYFLDPKILSRLTSGISESDLEDLCFCYFNAYESNLALLRKNQYDKKEFRKNFKPKIMFSNAGKKPEHIERILDNKYSASVSIKQNRLELISNWEALINPIEHLISQHDLDSLKQTRLHEIIHIIEEILETLSNEILSTKTS